MTRSGYWDMSGWKMLLTELKRRGGCSLGQTGLWAMERELEGRLDRWGLIFILLVRFGKAVAGWDEGEGVPW